MSEDIQEPPPDVVLTVTADKKEPATEPAPTEPKKEEKANAPVVIPISEENQSLAPTNHAQLMGFIRQLIVAKSIPKHLQNAEQVLSAWNFAAQLGLPPQPSMRNIAVIEGSPSLFGDLPLALVQRHAEFVSYEEYNIDKDYKRISLDNKNLDAEVWGGIVLLQRKGMKVPQSFAFVKVDADRAGLIERAKPNMPWRAYPQVMYIRRARIMAIRALFADALTGAAIAEDFGHAPDLIDVTDSSADRAAALNSRFSPPVVEKNASPQPDAVV